MKEHMQFNWDVNSLPSHQERVRKNNEYQDAVQNREMILAKAKEYLKHDDQWVRILAQIALFHYGD